MTTALPGSCLDFSQRVGKEFGRQAAAYNGQARLQRAMAWRLGQLCRQQVALIPDGPVADLGAGSGLLSLALLHHCPSLKHRLPVQLDICPELLALNPLASTPPASTPPGDGTGRGGEAVVWNLNRGLPAQLNQAALLVSSFSLQWLEAPSAQLAGWIGRLAPGGWLVLAVPAAGSFPQWRQAASEAGIPFTGLRLPDARELISCAVSSGMELSHNRVLHFTRPQQGGLSTLRHLHRLGAATGRHAPLSPGQIRRLLARWPQHTPLTWEVLVLLGRKR